MENNDSLWLKKVNSKIKLNSIKEDMTTDCLVIGAGLTGITTAYYLVKQGKSVILIDKDIPGEGTSGYTTAKITSQHGLIYKYLKDSQGLGFAKLYLEANQEALNNIVDIINNEKIDCDLERKDNFVYAENVEEKEKIKQEYEVLKEINPDIVKYYDELKVPIKNFGGVSFLNQAQFNPIKYMYALLDIIVKSNHAKVFINTRAKKIEQNSEFDGDENLKVLVQVDDENVNKDKEEKLTEYNIYANNVVVATHYPIINFPGIYFIKMYQEMSYAVAVKPNVQDEDNLNIDGMYINSVNPKLSIRTTKDINGDTLVIFVGNNSLTKEKEDLKDKYNFLIESAKKIYPNLEVKYKWNTQDCITLDKIPYIGRYSNIMIKDIYVATGYNKWGMTTSNIAASIIVDLINNKKNIYSEIFDSTRLEPIKNKKELGNMLMEVGESLVIEKIKNVAKKDETEELINMENNTGEILNINGKKVAVYKEDDNNYYYLKSNCKHLGCELIWNDLDKTWDCPCHGSRYEAKGKVIFSPSIQDLEIVDINDD